MCCIQLTERLLRPPDVGTYTWICKIKHYICALFIVRYITNLFDWSFIIDIFILICCPVSFIEINNTASMVLIGPSDLFHAHQCVCLRGICPDRKGRAWYMNIQKLFGHWWEVDDTTNTITDLQPTWWIFGLTWSHIISSYKLYIEYRPFTTTSLVMKKSLREWQDKLHFVCIIRKYSSKYHLFIAKIVYTSSYSNQCE